MEPCIEYTLFEMVGFYVKLSVSESHLICTTTSIICVINTIYPVDGVR